MPRPETKRLEDPAATPHHAHADATGGGVPERQPTRPAPADDATRERMEEALAAEREKYRNLFQSTLDAVYLTRSDGTILDANPAACGLHGMTVDEIRQAGRPGLIVDDAHRSAAIEERARTGRVWAEMTARRKDGTTVPVEVQSVLLDPTRPETSDAFVISRDMSARKRAEESLRESEVRLRRMFDVNPSGVVLGDEAGRVLYANEAYLRIIGRSREELEAGRIRWDEITPPEFATLDAKAMAEARGRGVSEVYEKDYVRPDGTRIPVLVACAAIGAGGELAAFIVDLSARKRAEQAVTQSEERLRVALDAAELGTYDHDLVTGRTVWDPRMKAIWGFPADAVIDGEAFRARLHPDDRDRVIGVYERALAGVSGGSYRAEYRVVWPDGSVHGCSTTGRVHFAGRGEERRPVRVVGVESDVTDRKRAEQLLRESEARLRAFVESDVIGILFGDVDGRVYDCNQELARIIGRTREDVLAGKVRWTDITPPEDLPLDEAALGEARATGRCRPYEKRYIRPDGTRVPLSVGYVLLEPDRTRSVAFILDITKQKVAEQALRDANGRLRAEDQRKNEFLGMLSHELRNPLAPIRNALYILDRAEASGQLARRAREIANRQVAHLTRLVDDLLDVTRVARGKIELRRHELDLVALANRTAEDYRASMRERGLDLRIVLPPAPVLVNGDETRLAQVLGNLLHNASKFTPRGGHVTLTVGQQGGRAVIHVRDDGVGMDPETLQTLFVPFVQARQTLARTEGGLGLGLALVKGLVELHGGEVTASSAGRGRGTEIVVRIPLDRRQAVRPRQARPAREPERPTRRRVLVVDDNRDAAASMAELLQLVGHEVAVAHDGPSALALAHDHPPDVVLCDIGLPGMDGYQVARQLRATEAQDLCLVAVSGYAQPDDVARAAEAGFDAHMAKPPDPEEIARLLARWPPT